MLLDLLTVAVVAYVGTNLVVAVRHAVTSDARERALALVRGLRVRHFALAPVALASVVAAFLVLYLVPPLRIGWWTVLGGTGNVAFGSSDRTAGTVWAWLIPAVFIVLLVPALPLLVEREERIFRLGAEHWDRRHRVWMGVKFGLFHLIAGIPVAAALAISTGGWWFTWSYLRGYRRGGRLAALEESTRAHLAYDLVVIAIVALSLLSL